MQITTESIIVSNLRMDDFSELPGIYNLKQFVLILVSKNLKLETRVIRSRVVEGRRI